MGDWSDDIYEALAARSQALYNNKHVLPVAVWIAESTTASNGAPDVVRGLEGRIASNKALEALERLRDAGMMRELPFLGRPHTRIFERRPTVFWEFALECSSAAGKTSRPAQPAVEGTQDLAPPGS